MEVENGQALSFIADVLNEISEGKKVVAGMDSNLVKENGEIRYGDTITYTFEVSR